MKLLAMDGGCGHSAFVYLEMRKGWKLPKLLEHHYLHNNDALDYIAQSKADTYCLEAIMSNGGAGSEVVQTAYWNGRFWSQASNSDIKEVCAIERLKVKKLLFGKAVGNDSAVLNYVQDLYGGRKVAKGTKKSPGPLYGVSKHEWQAMGLAMAYFNIKEDERDEYLWDCLYTETGRFHEKKVERRQLRDRKAERRSLTGKKEGILTQRIKDIK
jgi:hypothetical protein